MPPSPSRSNAPSALVTLSGLLALLAAQAIFNACVNDAVTSTAAHASDGPAPASHGRLEKQRIALPTGIDLAYVELGAARGEPVVFLHGITDTSRSFLDTARALADLRPELRLLLLDMRGHGDSSMPGAEGCRGKPASCFRPADFADDVTSFLDALGLTRADIVGHSLGSAAAQELALEHPERVRRLVLIGSPPSTVGDPTYTNLLLRDLAEGPWKRALEAKGKRFPEDVYDLTPLDVDPQAEKWMLENWVFEPSADPELLAAIAPETARVRIGTWLGASRAALEVDNRSRLRGLTVPTLVLWATQDSFFKESPQQADLLESLHAATRECGLEFTWKQYGRVPLAASGLPESDFAHNLHWGPYEQVAQDLAAFLREGGEPTRDAFYADPADVRRVVTDPGAAKLIEGRPRAGAHATGTACRSAAAFSTDAGD